MSEGNFLKLSSAGVEKWVSRLVIRSLGGVGVGWGGGTKDRGGGSGVLPSSSSRTVEAGYSRVWTGGQGADGLKHT